MKPTEPIIVVDLFRPLLDELLKLLESLSGPQWLDPTVCRGWSVKDIALHLLGGDIGFCRENGTVIHQNPQ
ncbi:MAG TPA: maleylpyruvate isomerase N-terminal domain-containing protein [Blastocatellia bacterium]